MPEEKHRQDLYEKSTEVRQLDMEKRTWGIHILYSSPAITTVLRSWRMRGAGNEACKRAMHIQKGKTLNIFDDIKVDLKQIWYQDMQQIHSSIQLEVFCGNNNKVWVLGRQMNDYWLLKSNCTQHRQSVDQLISYLWTTVIKSQRKVSLQWFQYRCGETFHSLWVASLVHCRSLGSNRQCQDWIY